MTKLNAKDHAAAYALAEAVHRTAETLVDMLGDSEITPEVSDSVVGYVRALQDILNRLGDTVDNGQRVGSLNVTISPNVAADELASRLRKILAEREDDGVGPHTRVVDFGAEGVGNMKVESVPLRIPEPLTDAVVTFGHPCDLKCDCCEPESSISPAELYSRKYDLR